MTQFRPGAPQREWQQRFCVLAALLAALVLSAPAGARCLSYEPSVVTLSGELTSRRVPGPPNYSNIARGDYAVQAIILVLDTPICVLGDAANRANATSHVGIREVQLAEVPATHRKLLNRKVRVTGELFIKRSGAHRTPVVLTVFSLRLAPKRTSR